jgi:hypothetical protein
MFPGEPDVGNDCRGEGSKYEQKMAIWCWFADEIFLNWLGSVAPSGTTLTLPRIDFLPE